MKKATSWEEVPAVINGRVAQGYVVAYGIGRSISGNEVWVDFGNHQDVEMVRIEFRDKIKAREAYCKGIRLELKIVEHPEHEEGQS
jgi:hypothetical protein